VHVLVDPALSLWDAHKISMQVEAHVRRACERPINLAVHVEPDSEVLAEHHEEV